MTLAALNNRLVQPTIFRETKINAMRLTRVQIQSYRSITNNVEFVVEPRVTVVLGPNDHGKSNLLAAIVHLNNDAPFIADDLNWDCHNQHDNLPFIQWEFDLSESDRDQLRKFIEVLNSEVAHATEPPVLAELEPNIPLNRVEDSEEAQEYIIPRTLIFSRRGVGSPLRVEGMDDFRGLHSPIIGLLPRVEIIQPSGTLSDQATAASLAPNANEFMRGIFYYADLDPDNEAELFTQNDRTQKRLTAASATLERHLKDTWSQGKSLGFLLRHDSSKAAIDLMIVDPDVSGTFVRASRRSSGFTNYFALKTILHARQRRHPAGSYIWLFDEPGIYLHPSGQFDLLRTLETLGETAQILYVTHSLFLINKSHPTRHRLVLKKGKGTTIEGKPYTGRWGSVLNALGITLAGTILFANHVILTEGDSDPIYIEALFQFFIRNETLNYDINSLSIMATGDGRNAEVLIRMLMETDPHPKLTLLFDGDAGGLERLDDLKPVLQSFELRYECLAKNEEIEDYLPMKDVLYLQAVINYAGKLAGDRNIPLQDDWKDAVEKSYSDRKHNTTSQSLTDWASAEIKSLAKLKTSPSKVGIAREYVSLLFEQKLDCSEKHDKALKLLTKLAGHLKLPQPTVNRPKIYEPE